MNKFIQRINTSLKKKEEQSSHQNLSEHSSALKRYESLRNSKEPFEARFDASDSTGALITYDDNNIKLIVHKQDQMLGKYQQRLGTLVGVNVSVIVKSVSKKENTVTLAMAQRRSTIVHDIKAEIDRDLRNGEKPRLYGRIVQIVEPKDKRKSEAWVRLLDRDIPATINVRNWSNTYTDSLYDVAKVGELYEFDIISSRSMRARGGETVYELSRRDITTDPWTLLPTDLKKDDVVLVKCVSRPQDKQYWWGTSPLYKGVNIIGVYNKSLSIVQGGWYKCYINRLDYENHVFRVLPMEFYPISDKGPDRIKKVATEINRENSNR